jgi:arginyl-tRNA synthetase
LGADHGGYVGRLKAISRAFGDEPTENLHIIIGQLVNLKKNGEVLRMSKRAGNVISIDDLVSAVGVSAARYSLVRSSSDTALELDLELLSSHTNENPVYYVQYAHARTQNVRRNAIEIAPKLEEAYLKASLSLLTHETETDLLGVLAQFSGAVSSAVSLYEPHRIARYLEELASTYHRWYASCRVIPTSQLEGDTDSEEFDLAAARLALNEATGCILRIGLAKLLGVEAPNKM